MQTSSTAIEDLQSKERLAYWYFQFDEEATQSTYNMIRSFIRQLSKSPLPRSIYRLWTEYKTRPGDPDIEELAKALDEIIDSFGEVFIVIDAVDECPQTNDRPERKKLLGCIHNLLSKHSTNLHVLATSRPEHDIDSELKRYPAINIETFVDGDIRYFVKSSLQSGDLQVWSDDVKRKIEEKLLSTEER